MRVFKGDRLRAAREAAGLSVLELGWAMRIGTTSIYGWERDAATPRANALMQLAEVLGVDVDSFFEECGGNNASVDQDRR